MSCVCPCFSRFPFVESTASTASTARLYRSLVMEKREEKNGYLKVGKGYLWLATECSVLENELLLPSLLFVCAIEVLFRKSGGVVVWCDLSRWEIVLRKIIKEDFIRRRNISEDLGRSGDLARLGSGR